MSNIDLSTWELQLPVQKGNSVEIIKPDKLKSYKSEYFYDSTDHGISFRCPVNGATTKNAKYPRSELRERLEGGEWNLEGHHLLVASCKVNKLAGGKGIIIGQIHGTDSDNTPQIVKLIYQLDGTVAVQIKSDLDPKKQVALPLGKFKINELITYTLEMKHNLLFASVARKVDEYYIENSTVVPFHSSYWDKQKYYFKAGCYVQNSDSSDDYALVTFYSIQTFHS